MRSEDYQPPITLWGYTYRLALAIAVSCLVWIPRAGEQWNVARWWFFLDPLIGFCCYVAVLWRRSHPVAVATIANFALAVSFTAAGPAAVALVSLATRRRWREIAPQVVLAVVASTVALWLLAGRGRSFESAPGFGLLVAVVCLLAVAGMYLGARRELLACAVSRVQLAQDELLARAIAARSAERSLIAGEMLDVVAHQLSVAGSPADSRAVTELSAAAEMLRDGGPDLPASDDLDRLLDEAARMGLSVDYTCSAPLAAAPGWLTRTLYRCVREGLENTRRHAPGAGVSVTVSGGPGDGVTLSMVNPVRERPAAGPGAATGVSLVGLTERVDLSGGWLSHGGTGDGRFELRVWLPWDV